MSQLEWAAAAPNEVMPRARPCRHSGGSRSNQLALTTKRNSRSNLDGLLADRSQSAGPPVWCRFVDYGLKDSSCFQRMERVS